MRFFALRTQIRAGDGPFKPQKINTHYKSETCSQFLDYDIINNFRKYNLFKNIHEKI